MSTKKKTTKPADKRKITAAAGLSTAATEKKKPGKSPVKSATTPCDGPLKPQPNYGISRIDQPVKKNHGFYMRLTGHKPKFFSDKKNGGRSKALALAKGERDKLFPTLPVKLQKIGSRKRKVAA